ncbi:OmpA family protein [Flavobacterium salilacus subsp. salilacus]|uniref:OmpA family protein n=1 Tax=Flavobacterium TaxID=237 RepID=UPI0013C2B6DE|nr:MULTISPECIES: OmpA family protein [Flavobacterium]KAF2518446.1 OmpA family protein [Flavobacterium salilacus subsp. salilacus]MBE1615084.1 OmpA family protein [Flavobacterium sp. SaA2.13]
MKKLLLLFLLTINTAWSQDVFTVYFDFALDEINTNSQHNLLEWIAKNKEAEIQKIYGYTDAADTDAYNVKLSKRRAYTVLNTLKANGLSILNSVEIKAFGENFEQEKNDADNRRVEIYYTTKPPKGEKEDPFVKVVKEAKKGDVLKVPNLHFYDNSDIILQESYPVLKTLLKILQENPKLKIDIQGHICCQNKEQNNISLKRAVAIYKYLIGNGIDANRLTYQSFGSSKPVYPLPEKNEEERVANRRVEIEIVDN